MMGDGQNLHRTTKLTVDQVEWKNCEMPATDGRGANHTISLRCFAYDGHDSTEFGVIAPAQTELLIFVIRDLFSMFRRRFGV